MTTRREFLQQLIWCLAAGSTIPAEVLAAPSRTRQKVRPPITKASTVRGASASNQHYKISNWTGDNLVAGHRLRDGDFPRDVPGSAEREYEFIIVGGGIGGLSSAYYLKDHDFLLLEQYDKVGGQSRGNSYRGIDYTYGPAYIGTVEGIYGQMYDDLGIKPEKLPAGDNAFYWQGKWSSSVTKSAQTNSLYSSFKKLSAEMKPALKLLPDQDNPESMTTPELTRLDGIPFSSVLKNVSPELMTLLNNIMKSSACGTVDQVSALAGYYLIEDLESQNYVFKGGNPAIATALFNRLASGGSERIKRDSFVWRIELRENGADVIYTDEAGQPHRVSCRHVIVATPPMVAWRQFANLPDKMRASLMPFRYGSYLVANFLMNKKLFSGSYDNWVSNPFSFADVLVNETPYLLNGDYRSEMGSVLGIYNPWEPGSQGRTLLFIGDRKQLSTQLYSQVSSICEHLEKHLEEIVLTRWGHAMVVPGVNFYARLRKIMSNYAGPYSFAHCSTQGMACAEAAIRAGKFAANRALATSTRTSMLVP